MSKLAALAAARKKKEGDKDKGSPAATGANGSVEAPTPDPATAEARASPLSLRERLAGNGKPRQADGAAKALGKGARPSPPLQKQPSPTEVRKPKDLVDVEMKQPKEEVVEKPIEPLEANIRAPPSTFATIIVGDATRPKMTEPSRLYSNSADLVKLYGEDLAEPFDFAGPSPDDVVFNAQNSAKGLAIRRKI